MQALDLARGYVEALNRGDREQAASLLASDAEIVLPGGTIRGRAAFLEHGAGAAGASMREAFEEDEAEDGEVVVLKGRYVMRWAESGEVAQTVPAAASFEVADGAITRVAFAPLT